MAEKLFRDLRRQRRFGRDVMQQSPERRVWRTEDSSLQNYLQTFEGVLAPWNRETQSYDRIELDAVFRDHDPHHTAVLDVMGNGTALPDLPADHRLAVTLAPLTPDLQPTNVDVLQADILSKRTWRQAQGWLEQRGLTAERFQLIMMRPLGGIENIPDDPKFGRYLLQELYALLSSTGGTLLTEVKPTWNDLLIDLEEASQKPDSGLQVRLDFPHRVYTDCTALLLRRFPSAPPRLP